MSAGHRFLAALGLAGALALGGCAYDDGYYGGMSVGTGYYGGGGLGLVIVILLILLLLGKL